MTYSNADSRLNGKLIVSSDKLKELKKLEEKLRRDRAAGKFRKKKRKV